MDYDEEQLIQDIIDALENKLKVSGLEISGSGGSIILSGTVFSEEARRTARTIVESIPGVRYVKNEIQVRKKETLVIDEILLKTVKETIKSDPESTKEDIAVGLEDGLLIIEGTVSDLRKKWKIDTLLQSIQGVQGYSLRLVAVPKKSISDEILAGNVLRELIRHKRIIINSLDITVENGIVILSGSVPSYTVKTAVYETALMTPGVNEVRDRVEVTQPF